MQIFILLPIYNEYANLQPLLEKIVSLQESLSTQRQIAIQIICVDDGSTDGSVDAINRFNDFKKIILVRHNINRGLGVTIRSGLQTIATLAQKDDAVVIMDSDDTHDPIIIETMIEKMIDGSDVVIASRYQKKSAVYGVPMHRLFLSSTGNFVFRLIFHIPNVRDYSCGFRMIRGSIIKKLGEKTDGRFFEKIGFSATSEFLINLSKITSQFTEVPFTLRYDNKRGKSKLKIFKTLKEYCSLLLHLR